MSTSSNLTPTPKPPRLYLLSDSEYLSWPKWKLALVLGLPVAAGVGIAYYWYRRRGERRRKTSKAIPPANKETKLKVSQGGDGKPSLVNDAMNAKNLGNKAFKEGKYERAIDYYTQAIELHQTSGAYKSEDLATFYQNRAASYEMLKKYDSVIEDCTKAISLNNKYTKALQRRAKGYEALGQISEALGDITAACILEEFKNKANLLMTDRLLKQLSKSKAKNHVKTRDAVVPSKHFIRHYLMSYRRHPLVGDPDVDYEKLEDLLKKLEEEQQNGTPREAEILLIQGTLDILRGNMVQAEKALKKIRTIEGCDKDIKVNALIKLATIQVHDVDGNTDGVKDAMDLFDEALVVDPKNPDIYIHRAQIYIMAEQIDEARKDLETCCQLDESFPSALAQKLYVQYRCACRYNDVDEINRAMKGFEEAVKRFSGSSEVHSLFAQALMEQQEFERAEEYFLEAIKSDPNDANLYVHRGILQLQSKNDVEKAVQLLEKGLKIDGKCVFAYEMLGSIEVQRGNLKRGIECFDRALDVAQTELDCAHLFSLRDAAEAQFKSAEILGVPLPSA